MPSERTGIKVKISGCSFHEKRFASVRKQRNSISGSSSSTYTTANGDSGNVSQEEHDDDQERYFDKIERMKRTENEVI